MRANFTARRLISVWFYHILSSYHLETSQQFFVSRRLSFFLRNILNFFFKFFNFNSEAVNKYKSILNIKKEDNLGFLSLIFFEHSFTLPLVLSWRRSLSYRNQSINLQCKSMDWFLYHIGLRPKRVNHKCYLNRRNFLVILQCQLLKVCTVDSL